MVHFKSLHLNDKILNALEKKGYSSPTEIQEKAIPHLLDKKDLLGIAQTGTGKTAAFSLPILHNLCENKVNLKNVNIVLDSNSINTNNIVQNYCKQCNHYFLSLVHIFVTVLS